MKRKCREGNRRERKLTRLILGAILLGAGTLGAPRAEATNYVINSYDLPSGMTDDSGDYAIYPTNGEAGDTVTISYGTWTAEAGRHRCFYGGRGSGEVSNRTLIMETGTIEDDLIGGFSYDSKASNNKVTINGGTLYLASSLIYGGWADNGSNVASDNIVNINVGATVQGIRVGCGSIGTRPTRTTWASPSAWARKSKSRTETWSTSTAGTSTTAGTARTSP